MTENASQNLRHIVLFKLHEGLDPEKVEKAFNMLKNLGKDNKSIIEWRIEKSLDIRRGIVLVENSLFIDKSSFEEFRTSEKHREATEFMRLISDWVVGDYFEDKAN